MGQKRAKKTQKGKARKAPAAGPAPGPDVAPAVAEETGGVPTSPLPAEVWEQLNQHVLEIEQNLQELRASMSASDLVEAIEPVLTEIKNDVDAGRAKSELAAVSLDQIRDDLNELRSQIVAVGRIGLRTEAQLSELAKELKEPPLDPPEGELDLETFYDGLPEGEMAPAFWERPATVLGWTAAVLVLSLVVYVASGNLKAALGALAGANLAGCTAILLVRKLL